MYETGRLALIQTFFDTAVTIKVVTVEALWADTIISGQLYLQGRFDKTLFEL